MKETLLSLFKRPSFEKIYFDFNQKQKHQCREGVYKNYCCSNLFKNSGIGQHKDAIVIQIGTDDFDVCCPLKSKATIHKMTAIYFQIRNFPIEYNSKLKSISLLALVETENTKAKDASINEILDLVRQEFNEMSTNGIQINGNINLKVFLFNVVSDNLGINGIFGYTECFKIDYMCRLCTMTVDEWRNATIEDKTKLRTESTYSQAIGYIDSLDANEIDLKISQGVKRYCVLNDINHFHVTKNLNVDLMHDVLEGVVLKFLHNFLKYCSEKKISYAKTQKLIRDFVYGFLFKRKLPSLVKKDSTSLNQNATQIYTIILHLPFIFKDYKSELGEVFECMTSLLQIMQILFSSTIYESDVKRLEELISMHLESYKNTFKVYLSPKHHFLNHYPHVIREMGPVIHTWMMRFEAYHKKLASFGKKQCFKNIALTIAERNQISMIKDQFSDSMFNESQRKPLRKSKIFSVYEELLNSSGLITVLC